MKNIFYISITLVSFTLTGCSDGSRIANRYSLESLNGYDVPVCVNRPIYVKGVTVSAQRGSLKRYDLSYEAIEGSDKMLEPIIVTYEYCLEQMPLQVHLVEKKDGDMTICYDRNNKIKLPLEYCQKDINVIQQTSVNVKTSTNVKNVAGVFF